MDKFGRNFQGLVGEGWGKGLFFQVMHFNYQKMHFYFILIHLMTHVGDDVTTKTQLDADQNGLSEGVEYHGLHQHQVRDDTGHRR